MSILKSAVETKILSQKALDSFLSSINTVSHEFTKDLKSLMLSSDEKNLELFFDKYGHLRPGTYDITSLSYIEAKEKYLSKDISFNAENNLSDFSIWNKEKNNLFDALRRNGIQLSDKMFEKFLYSSIEAENIPNLFSQKSF